MTLSGDPEGPSIPRDPLDSPTLRESPPGPRDTRGNPQDRGHPAESPHAHAASCGSLRASVESAGARSPIGLLGVLVAPEGLQGLHGVLEILEDLEGS